VLAAESLRMKSVVPPAGSPALPLWNAVGSSSAASGAAAGCNVAVGAASAADRLGRDGSTGSA